MWRLLLSIFLLVGLEVQAKDIAGVAVQESITTDAGVELKLNGAGIRSKFIFDIYIAQLYLVTPVSSTDELLASDSPRRMVMHILYDEVGKDKLVDGWNTGFSNNSSEEVLTALEARIADFNAMFSDVTKGQQISLDYIPGKGTTVTIAGETKGAIAGKDFNDALLLIWLGQKPVNKKLKKKLLGG